MLVRPVGGFVHATAEALFDEAPLGPV